MWMYDEAIDWLYARQSLGIKLGLEKVQALLAAIGDPHAAIPAIHIAGTNGKGSTARFLASILGCAGERVGLFTSPHLSSFTERIEVDGVPIAEAEVASGLATLRPIVDRLDDEGEPPTFFEITFALAARHFAQAGVERIIWETGMGGRLDATNIVEPELCVITNVGMDHQEFLGASIDHIATEKAGIMKAGVPCVTAADGDALQVLKARSHAVGCPMSILGEDYDVLPHDGGFRLRSPVGESVYRTGLAGGHQATNAALAVMACDALATLGTPIAAEHVQHGLAAATHPGRMETIVHGGRTFLLDGAHNLEAATALRRHLADIEWGGFHLIVGFQDDKPWRDMLDAWEPLSCAVTAVPLRSSRTADSEAIGQEVSAVRPFHAAADAADALADLRAEKVLVAGSLWLVGDVRALLTDSAPEPREHDQ